MERVAEILRQLYKLVEELEEIAPGRKFTPDGHMVGSIGETWAKWMYGVELLPNSTPCHDAKAADGRLVQVKATQGASVALYEKPDHLVVLRLLRNGSAEEVYNGPGSPVWERAGKAGKNGQRQISVNRLTKIMESVDPAARLPKVARPASP